MNDGLAAIVIASSLALALWSGIAAARDHAPNKSHQLGMIVVELVILVQVGAALAGLIDGHRPAELIVFIGYLLTAVLLFPGAYVLSSMEPTRWGSAIIAGAALTVPVLMLRLQQLWAVTGG